MEKVLMKGNEAFAEAAIRGGAGFYFGYPITPQNEIPEYMSHELEKAGGSFIQAESELAAVNMAYGAAAAGGSVFISTSSPGVAEPVRMNCPGSRRLSTSWRTAFQSGGASCHSSRSRGVSPFITVMGEAAAKSASSGEASKRTALAAK